MQYFTEKKILLEIIDEVLLFGRNDENLRLIMDAFQVNVISRNEELIISGNEDKVNKAYALFTELLFLLKEKKVLLYMMFNMVYAW